jgi:hypothetical protein
MSDGKALIECQVHASAASHSGDHVSGAQITLESVRANGNYNALASVGDREMHNAFRYDRQRERWEDSRKDRKDIQRKAEKYGAVRKKKRHK